MRRAVFLDRDDTLIPNRSLPDRPGHHPGDLADPDLVSLLPGALDACRALHHAGFLLVACSNQGAIARGSASVDQVHDVNRRLLHLLRDHDGSPLLAAVYFCPFHPDGRSPPFDREHAWRKPAPGMFLAAAHDFGIDLHASWAVGDQPRDLQAAQAAGIPPHQTILLTPNSPISHAARRILDSSPQP